MTNYNLMVIRQEIKKDPYNELFSEKAAIELTNNIPSGTTVVPFYGKNAKITQIETRLQTLPSIDFIIHYGHGRDDALLGKGNDPAIELATTNQYLGNKTVSTVSCHSFKQLGSNSNGKGYLGHNDIYWVLTTNKPFLIEHIVAATVANRELLNDKTYGDAIDAQKLEYEKLFNKYSGTDSLAASIALENKRTLQLKGNRNDKVV